MSEFSSEAIIYLLVTIVSIFLTTYVNRKTSFRKLGFNNHQNRYNYLYVPLIKAIYRMSQFKLDYKSWSNLKYNLGSINREYRNEYIYNDPLIKIINKNLQYASNDLINAYLRYLKFYNRYTAEIFERNNKTNLNNKLPNMLEHIDMNNEDLEKANQSLYILLFQILSDGQRLANQVNQNDLTPYLWKRLSQDFPNDYYHLH